MRRLHWQGVKQELETPHGKINPSPPKTTLSFHNPPSGRCPWCYRKPLLHTENQNYIYIYIDTLNSKLRRPTFCCSCYLTPCEQLSIWMIPHSNSWNGHQLKEAVVSTNQISQPNSSFPRRFSARGGLGWEAGKRLESSDMGLNSSSLQTTQAVN